ncbi:guanylate kinase [Actinomyces sp.]
MSTSKVTVIAGPTAVGKGTVIARLRERFPQVELSISMTTRSPRPGEVDGVHYHFVSEEEFLRLVDSGQMLESALVHGKYHYGTPRGPVDDAVKRGVPFLLEIDIAGVRQVRESLPDAQFVFLAPPSWEELVARLVNRGTEDAAEQERRLLTAKTELAAEDEFDVTVVNDDLETAVEELAQIMGLE